MVKNEASPAYKGFEAFQPQDPPDSLNGESCCACFATPFQRVSRGRHYMLEVWSHMKEAASLKQYKIIGRAEKSRLYLLGESPHRDL